MQAEIKKLPSRVFVLLSPVLVLSVAVSSMAQKAQKPSLVKDINTGAATPRSSHPASFTKITTTQWVFSASSPAFGEELWITDTTAAGTKLVKDLLPGNRNSSPREFTSLGSRLYFTAVDAKDRRGLWRTDGTASGTALVKGIEGCAGLTVVRNALFFVAGDAKTGNELWKSDGTAQGTGLVRDIRPGPQGSLLAPSGALGVDLGGVLYFLADDGNVGRELWRSDGTALGTVLVKDIHPYSLGVGSSREMVVMGSTMFFVADDGVTGLELWKSNGTASGTVLVKDIRPGRCSQYGYCNPQNLTVLGQTLFFAADNGTIGREFWKSDGTPQGTVLVKDILPGATPSSPKFLTAAGKTLYFSAYARYGRSRLWKSDGTASGTVLLSSIEPGPLTAVGSQVYFAADVGNAGKELWNSDGTAVGTTLIKDINPGAGSSNPTELAWTGGQRILFRADDGQNGEEPWFSGGLGVLTFMVTEIHPDVADSSPAEMENVGGTTCFTADDGKTGRELWKSDGTQAGTVLLKDIQSGTGSSSPDGLINIDRTCFFAADDGMRGRELWKTDGTASGTVLVKDIKWGSASSSPADLTEYKGLLFFSADDWATGRTLWKSDGTASGTLWVKVVPPPGNLKVVGHTLFFSTPQLWKSDGTILGTVMVKNLSSGNNSSVLTNLTSFGGNLFFHAMTPVGPIPIPFSWKKGIWKSDGTAAGTVLVKDLTPYLPMGKGPFVREIVALDDHLFFDLVTGYGKSSALCMTDGTTSGSIILKVDIGPGPPQLAPMGRTMLFVSEDSQHGTELWKTDGTAQGTVLIRDICPGSQGSNIRNLFVPGSGRFAWFAADDGVHGSELWRTDGTAAGTVLVHDIDSGGSSSIPGGFALSGRRVFFSAADTVLVGGHARGRELWSFDAGATSSPVGHACGQNLLWLRATDPVLGQNLVLQGREAVPNKTAILYVAAGPVSPLKLGTTGCVIYLDLGTPLLTLGAVKTSANGSFKLSRSIPNDPAALGWQATCQALVHPTGGVLGFDLSNGVSLVLGR